MKQLIVFSIIGFIAQLIDGAMGMGYGATSATLLLMFGVAPAVASASIHMAEIATTAASGASHLWFKNVDRNIMWKLVVPGSISAFLGAAFLSSIPGQHVKPVVSILLLLLGAYIMLRFLFPQGSGTNANGARPRRSFLIPVGIVGGFFDAVGGGGWGPIATPMLLTQKGISPRKAIGTVDTSEFAIAVSATLGFIIFLGWDQFHWPWVFAFMIGGVIAAPLAAWLVKILPAYMLGVIVGGFIILTNSMTIVKAAALPASWATVVYATVILVWVSAILYQLKNRKQLVPVH
ncbi:sulfite exporter TauE/SafE family protein [Paenibacillus sp. YYML68]|uniref:sulfite exporter TauE/SafE family protein n=1 Tax=Paenibacillus sp. YYML68 TaxID=2909250 RepID=UPI002493A17E|nr:sulfite exporter TauE/SafE family protein [Paenibacillus sp. YYML68]